MKKKFKDTKIGHFLKEKGSGILDIADDFFPPLEILSNLIGGDTKLTPEEKQIAQQMLLEEYRLEIADRDSARMREVELSKSGNKDILQKAAGVTALGSFILMIVAVIWRMEGSESPLFHQLMGIIEGVALSVFGYYFGTSKSSSDKTKLLVGKNP